LPALARAAHDGSAQENGLSRTDYYPAERQGTPVVDHAQHQGQAAPSSHTAVHHQVDGLLGQSCEQFCCDWQEPAINAVTVVFHEAGETLDQAFLPRVVTRGVIGNARQMSVFAADQPTDQRDQGIEMLFAMSARTRLSRTQARAPPL